MGVRIPPTAPRLISKVAGMLVTVVVTVLVCLALAVIAGHFITNNKLHKEHNGKTRELHERLKTLEDRFYHPANYEQAFIRPTAKKKD